LHPGGVELAQARSGAEKEAQQHAAQASCKMAPAGAGMSERSDEILYYYFLLPY
jgi:hypothetical protein